MRLYIRPIWSVKNADHVAGFVSLKVMAPASVIWKGRAPTFADVLLAIPQDGGAFERIRLPSRPVDF